MTINRDVANIASRPNITRRDHVYPLITNGDMRIAQRGTSSTGVGANNQYETVDMFRHNFVAANSGRLTSSQSTDVPTGSGFKHSLKLDCTTADTSIGASEWGQIYQGIEGQDLALVNKGTADCSTFTVVFWAKGTAKTYICELYDAPNNRRVAKTFTVSTSWTKHVINFPADTSTDDDFTYTNAAGLNVQFQIHAGTNYTSGTLNSSSWASATTANRVSSSNTSFFDSTDRTFFLTGLQLETSSIVTPFEHRSIAEELPLCQRYFIKTNPEDQTRMSGFTGCMYTTTQAVLDFVFPVEMRAAPTVSIGGSNNNYWIAGVNGSASGTIAASQYKKNMAWIELSSVSTCPSNGYQITYNGQVDLNAEF